MTIIRVLFFVCIACAAQGQKMSITSLINDIYKDQIKAEKIDTVLFLNECQKTIFLLKKL
jgi:hypothetical protein